MARSNGKDRKEEIIEAGLEIFAQHGYYNTTTALIAEKAGISQPYVFRFFPTKEELFIAVLNRAFERILQTFKQVQSSPEQLGNDMVKVYEDLSDQYPNEIALQVISMGITEEAIRSTAKAGLSRIRAYGLERFKAAGIPDAERNATIFIAMGMMFNISCVVNLPELFSLNENQNNRSKVYFAAKVIDNTICIGKPTI